MIGIGVGVPFARRVAAVAWPYDRSITTRVWGIVGNGAVGGSGYTELTMAVALDLEAQCDQFRLIFANTGSEPMVIKRVRGYFSSAAPTPGTSLLEDAHFRADQTNDAFEITFAGAAGVTIPAYTDTVSTLRVPKYQLSDWVVQASKARTDAPGHNRPLLCVRVNFYCTPTQNIARATIGSNTTDHYSNGVLGAVGRPDVDGRWLTTNMVAGDKTAAAGAMTLLPYGANGSGALCGIQYRSTEGPVLSFAAIGDSITDGSTGGTDTVHSGRRWPQRLSYSLSSAGYPAERLQFGYGGYQPAHFRAMWEAFVAGTGIAPPLAIYAPYSPNLGPSDPYPAESDLTGFVAHAAANDIRSVIWTGLPSSKWSPSYVETRCYWTLAGDAARVAYNTDIMSGIYGGDMRIDQATQFQVAATGSEGSGSAWGMKAALTNGGHANPAGWHPDYAGYTAMRDTFLAALTADSWVQSYFSN